MFLIELMDVRQNRHEAALIDAVGRDDVIAGRHDLEKGRKCQLPYCDQRVDSAETQDDALS